MASPAATEVADKEPLVGNMWACALGINSMALLLEALRPRLGLLMASVGAFIAWAGHMEFSDPHVGPAILSEFGPDYINVGYASFAVGLLGPLVLVLLCSFIRRRKT